MQWMPAELIDAKKKKRIITIISLYNPIQTDKKKEYGDPSSDHPKLIINSLR